VVAGCDGRPSREKQGYGIRIAHRAVASSTGSRLLRDAKLHGHVALRVTRVPKYLHCQSFRHRVHPRLYGAIGSSKAAAPHWLPAGFSPASTCQIFRNGTGQSFRNSQGPRASASLAGIEKLRGTLERATASAPIPQSIRLTA
jgi:hypothetical protein